MTQTKIKLFPDATDLANRLGEHMTNYYTSRGWHVDEYLKPIIKLMSLYGADDPLFESCPTGQTHNLMLGKGICLQGTVGASKTTLMKAFNEALRSTGTDLAFRIYETMDLKLAFEKEKGGGMEGLEKLLCPKGAKDAYYDEIGKKDIAPVKHFSDRANVDLMMIEMRYKLFQSGILTHTTTNLTGPDLDEWLTAKYSSRFYEMMNVIPYNNATDYRRVTRPVRRRAPEPVPEAIKRAQVDVAQELILTRFIADVRSCIIHGELIPDMLLLKESTQVYDILVERGFLKERSIDTGDINYAEAVSLAKETLRKSKANLHYSEKREAERIDTIIAQIDLSKVKTGEAQGHIATAFKKVVLRKYVISKLNTEAAIDKEFKKAA